MSPPSNSSHEGRTSKDLSFRHAHAPASALKIHGTRARQRIAGDWTPAPAPFSDQDHEGSRMTALPLPRARVQLAGISGSAKSEESISIDS